MSYRGFYEEKFRRVFSFSYLVEAANCIARLKAQTLADLDSSDCGDGPNEAQAEVTTDLGGTIRYVVAHVDGVWRHEVQFLGNSDCTNPDIGCAWMFFCQAVLGIENWFRMNEHDEDGTTRPFTFVFGLDESRQLAYAAHQPRIPAPSDCWEWDSILTGQPRYYSNSYAMEPKPAPAILTKEQITRRFDQSADNPPEFAFIAFCYAPPSEREYEGYTCPKCGERTLYTGKLAYTADTIPTIRSIASRIGGISVEIDEISFCQACNPSTTVPKLAAIITFKGDTEPRRVAPVSEDDIFDLHFFLTGQRLFDNSNKDESRRYVRRLHRLLVERKGE